MKKNKFDFDFDAISLDDLKILYSHFQIEDFGGASKAMEKSSFFNCFIDGTIDGNKDAFLLIRLASLLANNVAKIIEVEWKKDDGSLAKMHELGFNKEIEVEFDTCDYDHFNEDEINIINTIDYRDVETTIPLLTKYHFVTSI
jgi:DUF1009 family protein